MTKEDFGPDAEEVATDAIAEFVPLARVPPSSW
jgi:hypothetical protein